MSTNIPARNRQLAMQAKLGTSDESMRQFLNDWLLGHVAFDRYDAALRAQLVVDLQRINGINAHDWHVTAAALAWALEQSCASGLWEWINTGEMYDAYGNDMADVHRAVLYWRNVASVPYRYYAACSVEELLDGSDRDIYD